MKVWTMMVVAALAAQGARAEDGARLLEGEWVRAGYLSALRATQSPFSARPETVRISSADGGRLEWSNYHEQGWRRILDVSIQERRAVLTVGPWGDDPNADPEQRLMVPLRLKRDAAGRIQSVGFVGDGIVQHTQEGFVRVEGGLAEQANRLLLEGRYRDTAGRVYRFGSDRQASWPGRRFAYDIAFDAFEAGCPYLTARQGEQQEKIGYHRSGETLRLYRIVTDPLQWPPQRCEQRPFAVLRRVGG